MRIILRLLVPLSILILAGCNLPQSTPAVAGPAAMYTYAAQTVQAQGDLALSTPAPTMTYTGPIITLPAGGMTPVPTATPLAPGTPPPFCNAARFVSDVTIPDDTPLKPGAVFLKTWRVTNVGSCTWDARYALQFVQGNAMGAPARLPLGSAVLPGLTVDITVKMIAPLSAGTYQGDWKFQDASGIPFGFGTSGDETIWARIQVVP